MRYLKQACINRVAREIARPRVNTALVFSEQQQQWAELQSFCLGEAEQKINSMTHVELLALIEEVSTEL